MEKIEIAEELLKNTPNIYMQKIIQEYRWYCDSIEKGEFESDEDTTLIRFHNCISYIKEVGFDIRGWGLWEIPIFYSHCFYNKHTKEQFDLAVLKLGEVIPRFINHCSNEQDANSIQEAIENYS
ncbi:hypothetical protein COO16_04150 [Bacillus pseudomycoides]|uniref:hypothetical protein n=1 Tax=Bacillus pseudomycoides TaxID=64104 RepID=UPI000BEE7807|nr:hypothetical protein [Bacillus pseudomycoides]PDY14160.1 hypothetical protein COO16_04150 [Bacillus pseudomycoides]